MTLTGSMHFSTLGAILFSVSLSIADAINICNASNSTELRGVCIFAIDCVRLKGQHLGVCVDRLLLKSCCALPGPPRNSNSSFSTDRPLGHEIEAKNVTNDVFKNTESPGNRLNINVTHTSHKIRILEEQLKAGLNIPSDTDPILVCGKSYHNFFPAPKIVGGRNSKFAEWPWQVSLRHRKQILFSHSCGGVLVSNTWVLTVAHCVHSQSLNDVMVRLGEFDRSREDEIFPHVDHRISKIIIHPHYKARSFRNDIALLRLAKPATFRANILPVCLPLNSRQNYTGQTSFVTGWGQIQPNGVYANVLQEVQLPIMSNFECREMFRKRMRLATPMIRDTVVCAAEKAGGKDSCDGDSGGPMVILRKDDRWELVGITSWGLECGKPGLPGVYTRVSKFIDWMQYVMT